MTAERKEKGLLGDISRTLTGNLVFAAAQWFIIIVVARLGSPEQVGYVTLAAAIVTPIFALTGLSLRDARSVDVRGGHSDHDYMLLRIMMNTTAVLLSGVVILGFYGDRPGAVVFAALGLVLTKVPHTQSLLHYGIAQTRGRFDVIVTSQVLRGLLGVMCFGVVFAFTGSVGAGFVAQSICWAVVLILAERRPLARDGVAFGLGRIDLPKVRRALALMVWMLPLAIAGVLQVVSLYVPRLVLAEYVSFEALGLFGAIYYFLTAIQTVIRSISQASVSRMAKAEASGNRSRFWRITGIVLAANAVLGLFIIAGAYAVGEWVVAAVYGAAYVDLFLILMVAVTAALQLIMGVTQYTMLASHHFWLRMWVNGICLVAAIGLSFLFIPASGVTGAAWVILWVSVIRLVLGLAVLGWSMTRPSTPQSGDADATP
ncbi:lipopolysaccharide biosynthesis protein [Yoonia sp. R2331]|uniref:lipopolysaccharide biosynthesis protein n=1 Tax=Yoonia sp. R2331 TaxID=3237238 RepID=UPI0034E58510